MMIRYVMCIQCVDDQTFIEPLDTLRFRSSPTPPKRPKGVEFRLKSDYTGIWYPAEFMWYQTFIEPLDTLRFRSSPTPPKRPKGVEFRLKSDYTGIWYPAEFMWCFKISSDEQMGNVPYELKELEGENDQ